MTAIAPRFDHRFQAIASSARAHVVAPHPTGGDACSCGERFPSLAALGHEVRPDAPRLPELHVAHAMIDALAEVGLHETDYDGQRIEAPTVLIGDEDRLPEHSIVLAVVPVDADLRDEHWIEWRFAPRVELLYVRTQQGWVGQDGRLQEFHGTTPTTPVWVPTKGC